MARNVELGMTTIEQTIELDVDTNAKTDRILNLEFAQGRVMRDNEDLQKELAATHVEVIKLRACQSVYKIELLEVERFLADLRVHPRGARHR